MGRTTAYVKELAKLPAHQRRVLVPLVTWQIALENPQFVLDDDLAAMVSEFVKSLGATPETFGSRLRERLDEAGISMALLRDLQLRSSLPPLPSTMFAPRTAPTTGQARGELGLRMMRAGKHT